MKPLSILRNELLEIIRTKATGRTLIAPSDYDDLVNRLTMLSGRALAAGGVERLLELVDQAIAKDESVSCSCECHQPGAVVLHAFPCCALSGMKFPPHLDKADIDPS